MPAFADNKNVMCYLNDIYVYLRARSTEAVGRGRPDKHAPKPPAFDAAEDKCMGPVDDERFNAVRSMASSEGWSFRASLTALALVGWLSRRRGPQDAEGAIELVDPHVFRACADPHDLPFSNEAGEGFENKIAEFSPAN